MNYLTKLLFQYNLLPFLYLLEFFLKYINFESHTFLNNSRSIKLSPEITS